MKIITIIASLLVYFCLPQFVLAENTQTEVRFQKVGESIVLDSKTGLMWAVQDNGTEIDWWDAKKYCEDFTAGGYDDWRLPDIKELATLYTDDEKNKDGYFIAEPLRISECCIWSSYDVLGAALVFSYNSGKRVPNAHSETYQLRALPVRGESKIDLKQYRNF